MKRPLLNLRSFTLTILAAGFMAACSSDDNTVTPDPEQEEEEGNGESRWITIAGAKMGDEPGDGNGGTLIYSVTSEDAKDPTVQIDPFNNGFIFNIS